MYITRNLNYLLSFCFVILLNSNAIGQKVNSKGSQTIKFFTLIDSTYEYWTKVSSPIECPDFIEASVNKYGDVYARVLFHGSPQVVRLVNKEWRLIGDSKIGVNSIFNDTSGNTFINTPEGSFILEGDSFVQKDIKYSSRWKEEWITTDRTKSIGVNYAFLKKDDNPNSLARIDPKNIILYPPNVKQYDNNLNKIFDAYGNLYTIARPEKDSTFRLFMYNYAQEKWEMLSGIKAQQGVLYGFPYYEKTLKLLIADSKVYLLRWDHDNNTKKSYITAYVYTGGTWNINAYKVAYIPNRIDPGKVTDRFPVGYVKHYLLSENGRYGIIDNKGVVYANPVFDNISIVKTPPSIRQQNELGEEFNDGYVFWCYELVQGNDTMYTPISTIQPDAGTLAAFETRPASTCRYCNGKGVTEEKTVMVQTKKWVGPVTISKSSSTDYQTHYDIKEQKKITQAITKTYTSAIPGHWEYSNIPKVIPKGKCQHCKGNPVKKEYAIYVYEDGVKGYRKIWN